MAIDLDKIVAGTDREMLRDFRDSLVDQAATAEKQIALLRRNSSDGEAIASLFRALHTIKGDAALCRFELGVKLTHPIESVLARLRAGQIKFTQLLAEAVLLALDRLELAVEAVQAGRPLGTLRLPQLIEGLEQLADLDTSGVESGAITLIETVTGFRPATAGAKAAAAPAPRPLDRAEDLRFFQSLALQFETRSPLYKGRSERLLRLASETNVQAGSPIDPTQLAAAVYMHDIGMMFLPESVWLKVGMLSDADKRLLHEHPGYAAGLMSRMNGWHDAALMIAQHHEAANGEGYPHGLEDEAIVPGAKILAIIDAFESVTLKHRHRGQGRSLLRAVAEVNASDQQFSAEWIGHFNQVIRGMLEG